MHTGKKIDESHAQGNLHVDVLASQSDRRRANAHEKPDLVNLVGQFEGIEFARPLQSSFEQQEI